ncbi:hypothetical protein PMAYCL1PPCAC_27162, partial [Pristionchus mayeri]
LSICAKFLRASTIDCLVIYDQILDNTTAPSIISINSRTTNSLKLWLTSEKLFSDPAAFIDKLSSFCISSVALVDETSFTSPSPYLFFGLPHKFWEKFINEKLSNGSLEWVVTGNTNGKITKAPLNLPSTQIGYLEWQKAKGQ